MQSTEHPFAMLRPYSIHAIIDFDAVCKSSVNPPFISARNIIAAPERSYDEDVFTFYI